MKTRIFFLSLLSVALVTLITAPGVIAQEQMPPFNVHVAPSNCSGNVEGAYVTIKYTYNQQTYSYTHQTDDDGWAYFTAPVGNICVYANKDGNKGGCDCQQYEAGREVYICLNNSLPGCADQ